MLHFFQSKDWPEITDEEIKKRARLLVIDDEEFIYKDLFHRDGYAIDKWDDVEDLSKLEHNYYDLVLLDVMGVGQKLSADQGLGILRHIRKTAPTQLVIAFSNSEYSLKYQEFFDEADKVLDKGADYVEFKLAVDKLLRERFSLGFYLNKVLATVGNKVEDPVRLEREAKKAILQADSITLKKYLHAKLSDPRTLDTVIEIVGIAIKVASAWKR